MADHEGSSPPSEGASVSELDLEAAISGLDQATRDFTRRLAEAQTIAVRATSMQAGPPAPEAGAPPPTASPPPQAPPPAAADRLPTAEEVFAQRLVEAEQEARLYLERAKQRADSLVASMIGAVEQEAEAIRHDAEEGMRARWGQVEADARSHLEEAVRVSDGIVEERQERLATLSERITGQAEALSAGLEDADRIRVQFEAFVRALALTADRIAQQPWAGESQEVLAELQDLQRPRPIAA